MRAGEIIVSDITYIWIQELENFAYLFLITDVYSRKIIGYCVSHSLKAESAVKALKMALREIDEPEKCIHHSDRGIQYCCHAYTNLLQKNGVAISMTENGDPLENAIAERINRTIKEEFTEDKTLTFNTLSMAKKKIPKFIKFYNEQRPHRSINMHTPAEAYTMTGELKRKWKSYYGNKQTKKLLEGEFL
jgi:transposase InsO family protein